MITRYFAPVVKWISRLASDQLLWVRILPGAQEVYSGYSLVVERGLAMAKTGVRFSLPAQESTKNTARRQYFLWRLRSGHTS